MDCPAVILIFFVPLQILSFEVYGNSSFSKENDIYDGNSSILKENAISYGNSSFLKENDIYYGNSSFLKENDLSYGNSSFLKANDISYGNSSFSMENDISYGNSSFSKENDLSESLEYKTAEEDEYYGEKIRISRSVNDDFKTKITTSDTFLMEHLAATNKYRLLHGVPELELDYKLAFEAEGYAKNLSSKSDSEGKPFLNPSWVYSFGETLFAVYSKSSDLVTGKQVADNWYSGCKDHNWVDNYFSKKSSRFSQLVWKETKKMGIGKATATKLGIVIAVARYYPAGNWGYRSAFAENVFPLKGKPERCEVGPTGRSMWNFHFSPGTTGSNGTTELPNPTGPRGRSLLAIAEKAKVKNQSSQGHKNDKVKEADREKKKKNKEKKWGNGTTKNDEEKPRKKKKKSKKKKNSHNIANNTVPNITSLNTTL